MKIRRAVTEDASLLSALAQRSKAYWGYDETFLKACRAELTVTPGRLRARPTFVAENATGPLGFYMLEVVEAEAHLAFFFVDPDAIGSGTGRAMWEHAVLTARKLGCAQLRIESDPNAETFYLRMGAERVGEVASGSIAGRMLPLLSYTVR